MEKSGNHAIFQFKELAMYFVQLQMPLYTIIYVNCFKKDLWIEIQHRCTTRFYHCDLWGNL